MNINKNAKNKGKSLKVNISWFHPNIVIVAFLIESMVRFDKSIYPVVLYEYYRIVYSWIYMET